MASEGPICRAALNQANVRWPGRLKAADGIMGDAAHQARKSDHNLGNAFDLTHDALSGPDCSTEARRLVGLAKRGDAPWLKYVIFNKRIASAEKAWDWRPYTGSNGHTHHMHVSIFAEYRDADVDWWDPPTASVRPVEDKDNEMTPQDWTRMEKLIDERIALVLRGDKTHPDHLKALHDDLEAIKKALAAK